MSTLTEKWRIFLLDTKRSNPNHYLALCLRDALRSNLSVEYVVIGEYGNAISRAREHSCNLFLAFDGEEINRDICSALSNICGLSVVWFTEDPYEIEVNKRNIDLFDLVFTNDASSVNFYGEKGRHMPLAASKEYHFHEVLCKNEDFKYDVFFAGTAWPNRVSLLRNILSELKELRVKIALPHNEHLPTPALPLPVSSYSWKTPNSEFCRIANRSKIVLSIHRSFSANGIRDTASTPGPRVFEIAMAGAFQLTDNSLPGMSEYFTEGKDYAGFNSPSECIQSVKYYLSNPHQIQSIAKSAQSQTLSLHTYGNRVSSILQEVEMIKKREATITTNSGLKKILFVGHNTVGIPPFGGVEVYQDLIVKSMRHLFDFYFYVPDRSLPLGQRYKLLDSKYSEIECINFNGPLDPGVLTCAEREGKFSKILSKHNIDLVHYQHFIGHPPSLPYISKALGTPSILSIHDFYMICNSFNLINHEGVFCDVENRSLASCDICLNATSSCSAGSQAVRRAFYGRMLAQADVIHANSSTTARILRNIYPIENFEHKLKTFGIPIENQNPPEPELNATHPTHTQKLQVALVGNFTKIKGGDVLVHALNQMRNDAIDFHIYGSIQSPYDQILSTLKIDNLNIYGSYTPGTLQAELSKMDVALFMSIWPETYCITLSEVWQAKVVPIASDIGALGERIIDGINGFKIPVGQPGDLVHLLRTLVSEPYKIAKIKASISNSEFTTLADHQNWLTDVYSDLLLKNKIPSRHIEVSELPGITLRDCGVQLSRTNWRYHQNPGPLKAGNILPARTLASKAYRYFRHYGLTAAFRRAKSEIQKFSSAAKL